MYATKKTSTALYKALYSGNAYVIHFKQSGLINIVFVSLTYGIGMPLLFPIAAFNCLNQYICERIVVAYNVPLPPTLDDRLTKSVISILMYAPILMLGNAYWMVSNPSIFNDGFVYIDQLGDSMKSGHLVKFSVDWATPAFVMAVASVFILFMTMFFHSHMVRWGFTLS